MAKLSVVISAFNEEKRIEACLQSVKFADEIIVINNTSTDKTEEIAKKYTKKVYTKENNLMLNVNKNFGFSKASNDWILCLDADERVTPELEVEIKQAINKEGISGYWIPRKNFIFGKWIQHSIWWPDYQLRLFKRGLGKFPEKHVHEMVEVKGATEKLKEPLIHENYTTVSQYLNKLDTIYTENEASNFLASGKTINWIDALRFPVNDFLKTFLAQKGYKDGMHGLVLSLLQAFYAEIVFVKIWEKQGFPEFNNEKFLHSITREIQKVKKEYRYWIITETINQTKNPLKKLALKIRRRILK